MTRDEALTLDRGFLGLPFAGVTSGAALDEIGFLGLPFVAAAGSGTPGGTVGRRILFVVSV